MLIQSNTLPMFKGPKVHDNFDSVADVVLHCGDTLDFLETIPNETAKLIITSPPYNLGKEYENKTAIASYLEFQGQVIEQLVSKLRPDGNICWQVGNFVENSEVVPLDILYYNYFKKHGLKLRNRIIWRFNHGLHASKRFSGRYETILWFTKSDKYTFNLDPVRVPSKYPGKRHFKGPKRGLPSGNPLGKNPSDVWEFVAQEWEKEFWDIPNVKANHPEKTVHPCQYPIELVERCVIALTNEYDWVLDPYCGVGSALVAALINNRKAAGVDKEKEYISIAKQRIEDFYTGKLKIRPIGKPVHEPTGKEKVSQIPQEWKQNGNGDTE
ncbi:MAG: site-specific DNA-methyltransferase [Ignavibacteriales bacterium]|nr:site-specific DNA-methyltransferase [Ignavibacteriales bacterium]